MFVMTENVWISLKTFEKYFFNSVYLWNCLKSSEKYRWRYLYPKSFLPIHRIFTNYNFQKIYKTFIYEKSKNL